MGNWKGWLIAGVIVLLELCAVAWALSLDGLSAPSELGRNAQTFGRLELPISVDTIVHMDRPGDATPLYQQALADYTKRPTEYGALDADDNPDTTSYPAFTLLSRATKIKEGSPLMPQMTDVLRFGAVDREPLVRIKQLGELSLRVASKHALNKRERDATELFEATFALGSKLWNERIVYQEAELGLSLMASSVAGLQMIAEEAGDTKRAKACKEFNDARSKFVQEQVWPVWKAISDASDDALARHVGDLFVMSTSRMEERMWRVESILKLGYCRYNIGAGRRGDQVGAMRRVTELKEKDADPVVKQAAKVAAELTEPEFRRR